MKIIRSAGIECDNCGRAFQRIAPPGVEDSPEAREQLLAQVAEHARARGWRHHEYLEEDHCPHCAREFMAVA